MSGLKITRLKGTKSKNAIFQKTEGAQTKPTPSSRVLVATEKMPARHPRTRLSVGSHMLAFFGFIRQTL